MSKKDEVFIPALKEKQIPILTLDNIWHRLFTQTEPSDEILKLENELNELLKRQGKINTESREIKSIKMRLMDEIVELMDELQNKPSKSIKKKLSENKRLIEECNEKLEQYNDEALELPKKIADANYELMLSTMEACYEAIQENDAEIEEISKWVDSVRVELKKKVAIKQQKLQRNQNYYKYMHGIFGADVVDMFDIKYGIKHEETIIESNDNKGKE